MNRFQDLQFDQRLKDSKVPFHEDLRLVELKDSQIFALLQTLVSS